MNIENTYDGQLNLILGGMYASKTTELLRHYNRYEIAGKKCILIKYKNDSRYDANMITTHDNIKKEALICEYLYELDVMMKNYDVICIDEVQFYKDAHIFCDKWANQGKIIFACGLNGTFNRTPFPVISRLIPLSDNIKYLSGICKTTGQKAIFTELKIKPSDDRIEIIGGSEKYDAVDRKTYFKNNENKNMQIEFIELFLEKHNKKNNPKLTVEQFVFTNTSENYIESARKYVELYT